MARQRQLTERTVDIVQVLDDQLLLDSDWRAQPYSSSDGPLAAGLYLALRSAEWDAGFDADCRYVGPMPIPGLAAVLKTSALSFGALMPSASFGECIPQPPEAMPPVLAFEPAA